MTKNIVCASFLQSLACFASLVGTAQSQAPPLGSRRIWYTSPAPEWNFALPVGTGRLGGMVYGGTDLERVQMNEDSIWSNTFKDRMNPRASGAYLKARDLLLKEEMTAAGQVVINDMVSNPTMQKSYQPMVELFAEFCHSGPDIKNYTRWLDTWDGDVGSEYIYKGVKYRRTSFGSFPASVLVFHIETDKPGSINTNISLFREKHVISHQANIKSQDSKITLRAKSAPKDALEFTAEARIKISGLQARTLTNGTAVQINGADSISIYVDSETSYRYESSSQWEAELERKLNKALATPYQQILDDAKNDYKTLANRVDLDLGSSGDFGLQPTNERLTRIRKQDSGADPELATLLFNLGRYMLITSSRKETGVLSLPANLQGVWNPSYDPPWGGKYTVNINTEMNYWPAEITNLAETHLPLFDLLLDVVRPQGKDVAKRMYNCPGFVLHHNTDLWGDAAPVDNGTQYTMWPMGGAWLSLHMMEHYRFNGNKTFLSERAFPALQEAAEFYYCYLFEYKGHYSTGPSISPENRFKLLLDQKAQGKTEAVDIAPTMDNQILWELFSAIIEAAYELGMPESDPAVGKAKLYRSKIKAPEIGKEGTILEWRREYPESTLGHRHVSHLFGLHPGRWINMVDTPKLAAAASRSLDRRLLYGGGKTGWSRAWTINWLARLWQADAAWSNVHTFLNTSTNNNLFSNNPYPVFQCDGNFGFTAGIAEMLLQSHTSYIHLLPALPTSKRGVPTGWVKGLVARGGFVVDIHWEKGILKSATIVSKLGKPLKLRVADGIPFKVNGTAGLETTQTAEGGVYMISL